MKQVTLKKVKLGDQVSERMRQENCIFFPKAQETWPRDQSLYRKYEL